MEGSSKGTAMESELGIEHKLKEESTIDSIRADTFVMKKLTAEIDSSM